MVGRWTLTLALSTPALSKGDGRDGENEVGSYEPPLIEATTTKDMVAVWRMLIDEAKGGNVRAAELILQRVLGRAVEPADTAAARALDVVEEIEVKRAYRAAMHKPPVVVDAVPVEDESPANGA